MSKKNPTALDLAQKLTDGLANGTTVGLLKPKSDKKPVVQKKPRVRKPKAAKPEAAPTVVETPKVVEAPKPEETPKPEAAKPDPFAGLFEAGAALEATDVLGGVARKDDILANPKAIAAFVKAIGDADRLGISRLSFDRPEAEVRADWYGLSFAKIETQIQIWAKSGLDEAAKILAVFAEIRKISKIAVEPLWQLYQEIVRPAKKVSSYPELVSLLKELRQKKLVQTEFDRHNYPEAYAIRTNVVDPRHPQQRHWNIHMPAREKGRTIPIIDAGWPFLKEAEVRAKQWAQGKQDKLKELKNSASPTFYPADINKGGQEKTLYCRVGDNRGALLQMRKLDGELLVRVSNAIGLPFHTPTKWLSWTAKREVWPDNNLFHAFEAWKQTVAPPPPPVESAKDETKPKSRRKSAQKKS